MPPPDDWSPPPSDELKASYIAAADKGNWNLCRMICNTAGCGPGSTKPRLSGLSLEERIQWRQMYELACDSSRDRTWPELRAKLV